MTTGEGGMVTTNNKELADYVKQVRHHGQKNGLMTELGYNWRMPTLSVILGISQLKKLSNFITFRQKVAKIYDKKFNNSKKIIKNTNSKNIQHAYHFYPLRINFSNLQLSKKDLFKFLLKNQINLQVHYIPIFLQPYYKENFKFKNKDFPESLKFYNQEVSLPTYPYIKLDEINKVSNMILQYLDEH